MFERYTEHARRVIFFGRYEASQFGSEGIGPEHLLLALYRDDAALMNRFAQGSQAEVLRQIERASPPRPKVSTNLDLPLSHSAKRVLALGMEEADRMGHRHIGAEHLLLGLLREPSLAARILESLGVTLEGAREQIAKSGAADQPKPTENPAAEREALRSRMRELMLERGRQMGAGFAGMGGGWQEGHLSSSRMENGTMIFETRRLFQRHSITLIEKLRVSEDGKTLHYSQELRGPKGEHSWSKDFDIT